MNCEICNKDVHLIQDHNHITGELRGMVCISCNTKLGMYEKHLSRGYGLQKPWGNVVKYLEKWGVENRRWNSTNTYKNTYIKLYRKKP